MGVADPSRNFAKIWQIGWMVGGKDGINRIPRIQAASIISPTFQ